MTNRQIVERYKKDLVCAKRGLKSTKDPQMKAHYREIIRWCEFEIEDLEGSIAMGADSPDGGLAGWVIPAQVVRLPGLC